MTFSSAVFLMLFLPATMLFYFLGKARSYRNTVLLFFSIVFYAWGEPVFVAVLLCSVVCNYRFGILIEEKPRIRKKVLIVSLLLNLGLLITFKYLTFLVSSLRLLVDVPAVSIALPVGISFYTFQIMSYIFDVYYGKAEAQRSLPDLALYIMMFPQLIAGPIVRYNTIAAEIRQRRENLHDFSEGVMRFILGLAKKVLIADFLGTIADGTFQAAQVSDIPLLTAWIGAVAYWLETYYDFSGYSDMAIGLGRCFGFHFEENFIYPNTAVSINDFWTKWHLSLTKWFRDYVYIPLGGNRVSKARWVRNLLVIWMLTGIWHGAEWTYLVWGLLYFTLSILEKRFGYAEKLPRWAAHLYTQLALVLITVVFKADNMTYALHYLKDLFSVAGGVLDAGSLQYLKSFAVVGPLAALFSVPVVPYVRSRLVKSGHGRAYETFRTGAAFAGLVCSLLVIIDGSYSPFIYYIF